MINLSDGYSSPAETARFEPGDVIHHKRFNYRPEQSHKHALQK